MDDRIMDAKAETKKLAAYPFDRSDADVVFLTSDAVEFHLHTQILTLSSPKFGTMLKDVPAYTNLPPSHIPIFKIPENSNVLDPLLRYCYPTPNPWFRVLDEVRDVVLAVTKYGVEAAVDPLERCLRKFIKKEPVRVYAISSLCNIENLAHDAAHMATFDTRFLEKSFPELAMLPAAVYWNLISYYRNSQTHLEWNSLDEHGETGIPDVSWAAFPFDDEYSDVVIQSSDAVRFRLHRIILSKASSFFRQMFTLPQGPVTDNPVPIIHVSESGRALGHLFALVYPVGDELEAPHQSLTFEALTAAMKYDMLRPVYILKRHLVSLISDSPVNAFLFACQHGFEKIALESARQTLRSPFLKKSASHGDRVIDPRTVVPASVVFRLIKYRLDYTVIVNRIFSDTYWPIIAMEQRRWHRMNPILETACGRCGSRELFATSWWNVPAWLDTYLRRTRSAILNGEVFGNADEDSALDEVLISAGICTDHCRDKVSVQALRDCRKGLSKKIEEELSTIEIDTKF